MTLDAWITLGIIALVMAALTTNRIGVDVAMIGGLTVIMVLGIIEPLEGLAGFAGQAVMMIGGLFVVAAGLQETGGMEMIAQRILGRPRSVGGAQLRLMTPVALMSGLMNNTPIVAMYLPIVADWARKLRISPSKLYMPLSFAAILGGKMTLIGTASNIVVIGLYLAVWRDASERGWMEALGMAAPSPTRQFWGVAALGIPTTVAGIALIVAGSRWLLPARRPADRATLDSRRYQVEMTVLPDSPIIGRTIEEAGLRHLPGLYLTEIERGGDRLPAVPPEERIQGGDRLAFAGILESVVDLRKIRGLVPATDQVGKVEGDRRDRTLVEAVVSRGSPLVGRTVRQSRFRTRYNAAIIAVHRNGEHVHAKIGDIALQPGDTLLLDTHAGFIDAFRNSDDFYLVSRVEGSRPIRFERAWLGLTILGTLVVLLMSRVIDPVAAVFACALAMVVTRCVTGTIARQSINWQVLIVIGSALGLGAALTKTGAAAQLAHWMLEASTVIGVREHPGAMVAVLFAITVVFSQLVTNNGAAVLMFPIVMETARELDVSPEPFIFSLMIAAGCSFLSPVGYQTNLMVYGPGGYRFLDYARLGLPLTIVVGVITVLFAPLFFPFHPGGS